MIFIKSFLIQDSGFADQDKSQCTKFLADRKAQIELHQAAKPSCNVYTYLVVCVYIGSWKWLWPPKTTKSIDQNTRWIRWIGSEDHTFCLLTPWVGYGSFKHLTRSFRPASRPAGVSLMIVCMLCLRRVFVQKLSRGCFLSMPCGWLDVLRRYFEKVKCGKGSARENIGWDSYGSRRHLGQLIGRLSSVLAHMPTSSRR